MARRASRTDPGLARAALVKGAGPRPRLFGKGARAKSQPTEGVGMSRIFSSKKRALLGIVAALAIATAAMAYWTSGGTGTGEGDVAANATGTITLLGTIDDADLRPGHTSPISLTASNTDEETDLHVTSTKIESIDVTGDGDGCLESWFSD